MWVGTRSSAHTLTRSACACEHLRVGFKETEMSRNRAAPSLVGETDRHSRSGGPRVDGVGPRWKAGPGRHLTLGQVGAVVQVGGGGLLCLLCISGVGQQKSKMGQGPTGLVPMGGVPSSQEPTCWDLIIHRWP